MKQTRLWLTTIVALLCSLTANAHDFEVGGIYYKITSSADLTVSVTYGGNYYFSYPNEYSGAITIPSTVTYNSKTYSVTSIGYTAFSDCSSLTAITIPEGVTSLGEEAFYCCHSLTAITIPESVTSIGDGAFQYCGLTSITIPESVTSIGDGAFQYCSSLTAVHISNIEAWCNINFNRSSANPLISAKNLYLNDELVTELTIPNTVTAIKDYAFSDCSSLISITIPESVTSIGEGAFDNCTSLKSVIIEDGSTTLSLEYNSYNSSNTGQGLFYIGEGLFYDCPLEEVYLGRNLSYNSGSSFGYSPFYDKDALKKVTIGNEVTEIGQDAFRDCDNIHLQTIPNGVLSIGSNAFSTPEKVIWLTNTPPSGYVNAKGSINYVANDQYTSLSNVKVYPYLSSMFEVGGVKYVPVSLSERTCHAIDCAYDSTATAINVGETALFKGVAMKVTEVMPYTFYGNDHIEEVSVSHLGNIGDYAFCDCDGIKSVDISNRGSIGYLAFCGCNGMETANVTNKGAVGSEAFSYCSSLKTVTLGDSIGSLGDEAFYQCRSLQEIAIPDHVKSVGAYCFSGCSAMTNVALGRKVATINDYAFQSCSSLTEITLPQAVTKVGDYVFSGCSKLADVVIADRTTALALGSNGSLPLFVDCPLDSVYIGGKITYSTTSSKGYSPFYRNTSLRTVVITDREEQIYDNEFYGCTNLKSVTIGNGVKSIGDYAFSGCSSLDGFSFGSNMESIGTEAFSDCTNLTSITSHAAVPPICGTQALDDINKWSCTLRVPQNYATAYQAADQWKEFFFIEDVVEVEQYILTYVVDGEVYHTDTLVHKATIVLPEAPTKEGYTFSGWSEVLEVMPAEDVIISGAFIINKYLVTFKIGDEVIAANSLEYGTAIVVPEAPEREGHTFNGWGEVVETVPANDVTIEGSYSVNSYMLSYMVDGETVQSDSVAYGTVITLLDEPTKEGYTFSGWSEAPEAMPASDVIISGTFTVNKYLVTFKIDDEVIAVDSLEYGATIVALEAPEKEGYTFDGWGEVVETVPANDVTIEGSYSVNSYQLTYTVDGETVQTDSVAYGTAITLLDEPTKEGYTFSGWSEAPDTMPAEDVTISGMFTVNIYKVYYYVGEELIHTAEVPYGEAIPEYIYEPTKEDEIFEGWIGETYATMPAHDVTYVANITNDVPQLIIDNIDNSQLTIYDLQGRKVTDTENLKGGVYIINGRKVVIGD